jgi:hypothetical protein
MLHLQSVGRTNESGCRLSQLLMHTARECMVEKTSVTDNERERKMISKVKLCLSLLHPHPLFPLSLFRRIVKNMTHILVSAKTEIAPKTAIATSSSSVRPKMGRY